MCVSSKMNWIENKKKIIILHKCRDIFSLVFVYTPYHVSTVLDSFYMSIHNRTHTHIRSPQQSRTCVYGDTMRRTTIFLNFDSKSRMRVCLCLCVCVARSLAGWLACLLACLVLFHSPLLFYFSFSFFYYYYSYYSYYCQYAKWNLCLFHCRCRCCRRRCRQLFYQSVRMVSPLLGLPNFWRIH